MAAFDYQAYLLELEEELEAIQEEAYKVTCAIEIAKKQLQKQSHLLEYQSHSQPSHSRTSVFNNSKKRNQNEREKRQEDKRGSSGFHEKEFQNRRSEHSHPENSLNESNSRSQESFSHRQVLLYRGLPLRAAVRQYLQNQSEPKTKEDILQALLDGGFESKSPRFPHNLDPTLRFMVYDHEAEKVGPNQWQIK